MKRTAMVFVLGLLTAAGGVMVTESLAPRGWIAAAPAGATELGNQFAAVAKAVSPAVVHIRTEQVIKAPQLRNPFEDDPLFRRFFQWPEMPREFRREGLGSGLIVSKDGYILTNNHVVRGSTELTVKLSDKSEFTGKVVGTDPPTDLALVKIEAEGLPTAPLGDSDKIEIGHWVLAVGNPFGLDRTVTAGIISAKGRANVGVAAYEDFIQTDASINPGNSGGPLVNLDGEVIGINTAIASQSGGSVGIGFAIPINMARKIMADLKGPLRRVTRAWLGVQMGDQDLTPDLARQFGLDRPRGVLITDVIKGTPAEAAGLKQGDVILAIDGVEVNARQQLALRIAQVKPGTTIKLKVWRDKKEIEVPVTVVERTDEIARMGQEPTDHAQALGLKLQDLTDDLAKQLGVVGEKGVVVTSVETGSRADRAGLKAGDLIQEVGQESAGRTKVTSMAEFRAALDKLDHKKGVLILYRRKEGANFVVLKP